jgi:hypothetical protein
MCAITNKLEGYVTFLHGSLSLSWIYFHLLHCCSGVRCGEQMVSTIIVGDKVTVLSMGLIVAGWGVFNPGEDCV